jgi:hypothetical protein
MSEPAAPVVNPGDTLTGSISEEIRTPQGDRWVKYEATVVVLPHEDRVAANRRLVTALVSGLTHLKTLI